ncbi:MAG: sigma 54-interacting transcriptional regulator [Deltaproteobacteria bacterium]|jgi:psp operon transcriptional activator|nr:sigma 54-interacting transcriptional regulator [Deltaproteobacteria bacterium]
MTVEGQVPDLLGQSESLLAVKDRLSQAAKVDRPVLILGERGTGKELAAARLHFLSKRWRGPYLTLNCAALAPGLLDSELFGHEAGAFTGAARRRQGRFEAADGGSLFLDEISHLTMEAQARILRVVEYGSFQPVGGSLERKVDVRVIAATNADLRRMCAQGTFLPDLWDRLSFEVITLPPLRNRPGDVSHLAHYFAARMARELGLAQTPAFTPEALLALEVYPWPGNVRELKNMVERLVYRAADTFGHDVPDADPTGVGPTAIGPEAVLAFTAASLPEPHAPQPDGDGPVPAPGRFGEPQSGYRSQPPERPEATQAFPNPDPYGQIAWPLAPGQFDEFLRLQGLGLIERAMGRAAGNQKLAAKLLGVGYHRFRALRRKYSQAKLPE